jgi:hypothetical protein
MQSAQQISKMGIARLEKTHIRSCRPMKVRYRNLQDDLDPMNRTEIAGREKLDELLDGRRHKQPFVAELVADNGFKIVFGISTDFGCVEYIRVDGDLPYLMAVSPHPPMASGFRVSSRWYGYTDPSAGNFDFRRDEADRGAFP